jgi:DNA (cytosine-5)-methyltransferase 1
MKPRLLDLFCGAGGAAMGYHRAGFEVVGVDLNTQFNYPFEFFKCDALGVLDYLSRYGLFANSSIAKEYPLDSFSAIHASPPCQKYSHGNVANDTSEYPDLIGATRDLLDKIGLPYVIENVSRAPLFDPVVLCGACACPVIYDDPVAPEGLVLRRHRLFESNVTLTGSRCLCKGSKWVGHKVGGVYGGGRRNRWEAENIRHGGYCPPFDIQQRLMEIDWMTQKELNQAIPPAYTEFIGIQLLQHLSLNESKEN